jgi:hypothetical protein
MSGPERTAVVLATAAGDRRIVTGLTLGERGRRVATRAGFTGDRLVVVTTVDELRAAQPRLTGALLGIDARDQVVAAELVTALEPERPGARHAVIRRGGGGRHAGGRRRRRSRGDRGAGHRLSAASRPRTRRPRPRCRAAPLPVPDRASVRAADKWQYELVDKPPTRGGRYFYRPLAGR